MWCLNRKNKKKKGNAPDTTEIAEVRGASIVNNDKSPPPKSDRSPSHPFVLFFVLRSVSGLLREFGAVVLVGPGSSRTFLWAGAYHIWGRGVVRRWMVGLETTERRERERERSCSHRKNRTRTEIQ